MKNFHKKTKSNIWITISWRALRGGGQFCCHGNRLLNLLFLFPWQPIIKKNNFQHLHPPIHDIQTHNLQALPTAPKRLGNRLRRVPRLDRLSRSDFVHLRPSNFNVSMEISKRIGLSWIPLYKHFDRVKNHEGDGSGEENPLWKMQIFSGRVAGGGWEG